VLRGVVAGLGRLGPGGAEATGAGVPGVGDWECADPTWRASSCRVAPAAGAPLASLRGNAPSSTPSKISRTSFADTNVAVVDTSAHPAAAARRSRGRTARRDALRRPAPDAARRSAKARRGARWFIVQRLRDLCGHHRARDLQGDSHSPCRRVCPEWGLAGFGHFSRLCQGTFIGQLSTGLLSRSPSNKEEQHKQNLRVPGRLLRQCAPSDGMHVLSRTPWGGDPPTRHIWKGSIDREGHHRLH
jgi:hypothetical protein